VIWDLLEMPLPFAGDTFDEIHAYEVLEHTGQQGDWKFFFAQWSEFWRILKPEGAFFGTVPAYNSPWAWGDPSHTRVLPSESLVFLSQPEYEAQVGKTPMSDFRFVFKADFDILHTVIDASTHQFVLRAVKPSRIQHDRH
jgi:SAM-dependent methyltransferase